MLRLSHVWPACASSSWLLSPVHIVLGLLLALGHGKMSQIHLVLCLTPTLESAISPRSPGSLQSRMVLTSGDLGAPMLSAAGPSLFPGPLGGWGAGEGHEGTCALTHVSLENCERTWILQFQSSGAGLTQVLSFSKMRNPPLIILMHWLISRLIPLEVTSLHLGGFPVQGHPVPHQARTPHRGAFAHLGPPPSHP